MDKSLIAGTILGSAVAAGGGVTMQYANQSEPLAALLEPASVAQAPAQPQAVAPVQAQAPAPQAAPVPVAAPAPAPQPAMVQATPASYRAPAPQRQPEPSFARVVDVRPVEKTISTPRQQCFDEPVTETALARDKHQIIGTVGGALLGGILGHQVGDGRGKDVATVAGAAAGAFGGRMAQQQVQGGKTQTSTRQRCETIMENQVEVIGYDVRYELDGEISTVRMDYDPGKRIPLDNGHMMI